MNVGQEGSSIYEVNNNNNNAPIQETSEKGMLNGRNTKELNVTTEESSDSPSMQTIAKRINDRKLNSTRRGPVKSINWNQSKTVTADYSEGSKLWSTRKKTDATVKIGLQKTPRRPTREPPKLPSKIQVAESAGYSPPKRAAKTSKNEGSESKEVKSLNTDKKERLAIKRLPGLKILNQDIKQIEDRIKSETASMKDAPENEIEDLKQTIGNLVSQLKNMKNFKVFAIKNSKGLERIRKDAKEALIQSESIFDGNINTATKNAAEDTDKLFEDVINSLPDKFDTSKIENDRKEIQDKSYEMIGKYIPRKNGLFLAGMFSKYKNELGNVKNDPSQVKLQNIKSPGALDMIKSAGNDIKLIDDELVPSFVANIHKQQIMGDFLKGKGVESTKGAVASLTEKQQASNLEKFKELTGSDEAAKKINDLYTSLTHDYKARAVKSKTYLKNVPEFLNLLKENKII